MLTIESAQDGIDFLFYTTVFAASLITLYDFVNGLDQLTVVDEWMTALERCTFQPVLAQTSQPPVAELSISKRRHNTTAPLINPVLITPAAHPLALRACLETTALQRRHNQVQAIANPVLVTPVPKDHSGDRQDTALDSLTREQRRENSTVPRTAALPPWPKPAEDQA